MEAEEPNEVLDPRATETQATLDGCGDALLVAALPALLVALPKDAKERCLLTLRDALSEELHGGSLAGNDAAHATWQRALRPATATKPMRAMAAPFITVPAAASVPPTVTPAVATPPSEPKQATLEKVSRWAAELDEESGVVLSAEDPVTLYVANVPYEALESEIQAFLMPHCSPGHVKAVRLLHKADGAPKGACIVTFDGVAAASRVMQLDGKPGLQGRILMVREDKKGGAKGKMGKGKGKSCLPACSGKGFAKGPDGRPKRPFAAIIQQNKESEVEQRSVIIKNLDFGATDADIGELFAGCGGLAAVRIAKDGRKSKGFAVVELVDVAFLKEALARSGRELRGRPVRVEAFSAGAAASAGSDTQHVVVERTSNGAPAVHGLKHTNDVASGGAVDVVNNLPQGNRKELLIEATRKPLEPMKFVKAVESFVEDSCASKTPPEKRRRGDSGLVQLTTCAGGKFLGGEEGLVSIHKLLEVHNSPEAVLQAEGADAIKNRLVALGLKAGGSPAERAVRLCQLRNIASLASVPKALFVKASSRGPSNQVPSSESPAIAPASAVELLETPTMAVAVEATPLASDATREVIVAD